jgi:hypothetical protein
VGMLPEANTVRSRLRVAHSAGSHVVWRVGRVGEGGGREVGDGCLSVRGVRGGVMRGGRCGRRGGAGWRGGGCLSVGRDEAGYT